tara:strand:+ start:3324 stop:3692 length:369 start_codon:yes stop_codon:yes gene_type:complete
MSSNYSTTIHHPFTPCPDTPNCVIESHTFDLSTTTLYQNALKVLNKINPHKLIPNENTLTIETVFRIPLFGFKDDLKIVIQRVSDDRSILHIKSSSRIGKSDLGVNQRRINRIIKQLNKKLS